MNKKIYKGYELVKAIYDKQIKESTYIRVLDSGEQGQEITKILYSNGKLNWEPGTFTTEYLFQERYTFVLEDNTEEIEELYIDKIYNTATPILIKESLELCQNKINELVKAVNSIRKDKNND